MGSNSLSKVGRTIIYSNDVYKLVYNTLIITLFDADTFDDGVRINPPREGMLLFSVSIVDRLLLVYCSGLYHSQYPL